MSRPPTALEREDLELSPGFLALVGFRGPYVPRKPVLYGQLLQFRLAKEREDTARGRANTDEDDDDRAAAEPTEHPPRRRGRPPKPAEYRTCPICEASFQVLPTNPSQEACSRACAGKLRARRRVATQATARQGRNIADALAEVRSNVAKMKAPAPPTETRTCSICPRSFVVQPDRPNDTTCSRTCRAQAARLDALRADLVQHNARLS